MAVGSSIGGQGFQETDVLDAEMGVNLPNMEQPWWLGALDNAPGMGQTMGMTAFRGSNTITRGGFDQTRKRQGSWTRDKVMRGKQLNVSWKNGATLDDWEPRKRGALHHNLNPRAIGRYGDQSIFDRKSEKYSPFQFMSHYGNSAIGKLAEPMIGPASPGALSGSWRNKLHQLGETVDVADGKGGLKSEQEYLTKGGMSRASASLKIDRMSDRKFAKATGSKGGVRSYLANEYKEEVAENLIKGGNRTHVANAVGATNKGLSGYATGFLREATTGAAREGLDAAEHKVGATAYVKGAAKAAQWGTEVGAKMGVAAGERIGTGSLLRFAGSNILKQGERKLALKAGAVAGTRAIGAAIPGVNVAMAIWTAYDLTKMGLSLASSAAKATIRTGIDAYKSFTGNLNQAPFGGGGFKLNEASATSRSRGVQAIQNSRLNARSILGSEAGPMHAHFG